MAWTKYYFALCFTNSLQIIVIDQPPQYTWRHPVLQQAVVQPLYCSLKHTSESQTCHISSTTDFKLHNTSRVTTLSIFGRKRGNKGGKCLYMHIGSRCSSKRVALFVISTWLVHIFLLWCKQHSFRMLHLWTDDKIWPAIATIYNRLINWYTQMQRNMKENESRQLSKTEKCTICRNSVTSHLNNCWAKKKKLVSL